LFTAIMRLLQQNGQVASTWLASSQSTLPL
jgi:hypothetical protein